MTTTTANADKVMQHLEFCHQVLLAETLTYNRFPSPSNGRNMPWRDRALETYFMA